MQVISIFNDIGHIPLPPYMKRGDMAEDEKDFQSVFAKKSGAVASPTASLHFTKELFEKLKEKHNLNTITLHIGAGHFNQ